MGFFQYLSFYNDKGIIPEGLHLDGLFVVLPVQLADPFGGLLQHILSCLFLTEVKFGLYCLEQQQWMNSRFLLLV